MIIKPNLLSRLLLLFALPLLFVSFLTLVGCGHREEKTADGRIILNFWHTYGDQEEMILKEIIKDWEKSNASYTVQATRLPFDGHKAKLKTALTVERGPDMARVDWSFVCELARKNALVDLAALGFDKIRDQYLAAPLGTNFIDGKYFGLPDQTTCVALFYNKKMFREAGLNPDAPPKTWDEFIEQGKKLTDPTQGRFAFAMDNTLWWTLPFFNTFGAKIIASDGVTCLLDSKEAIAAMDLKSSLYNTHKIEAGSWRAGSISPDSGFVNGKYAMIFSGPWNLPKFTNSGIEFGVGLIPAGPAGTSTNVGGTNVVIFNTSKNQQACFDFLTYFTSAEVHARWCKALNQIPVNLKSYDLVKYDDPNLMKFLEQMKSAVANPIVTHSDVLEDIINPEMEAIMTGQKTSMEALKNAARKIEKKVLRRDS
ncbi:MAG: extracellular solute-binding protein [Candidatus Riflebacteria bacterium]|nr:extracellular solute-binding protein [Candidatus Riflebacteria bacterium]